MSPSQEFKVAFLTKCAEFGLTADETHAVVKAALANKEALVSVDSLINAAKSVSTPVMIGALAAPPLAGYAAGNAIAKMTDVDDADVDEMRQRHLLSAYRRLAADIKNRKRVAIA